MPRKSIATQIREILLAHPGEMVNELDIAQELDITPAKARFIVERSSDIIVTFYHSRAYYELLDVEENPAFRKKEQHK